MNFNNKIILSKASPSRPNLPNSPPQANVRHVVMQNSLIDPNSNASSGGSMVTHHQMAFEYNQNSANGLELAGFCSPSGKIIALLHTLTGC